MDRTGAEELRIIVRNMDETHEGFNDRYTAEELVKIYRAQLASGWDFYPDQWTLRQVREALRGIVPRWHPFGEPEHDVGADGIPRSMCCGAEVTTQHEATETMSEDVSVCVECGEECATDEDCNEA